MSLVCNDKTFSVLLEYCRKSIEFADTYGWISDAYVSDFFYKNHWDRFPQIWKTCLHEWTTEDLTFLLDRNKPPLKRKVSPLSILSFKVCTQTYSFDRNCVENFESVFQHLFPKEKEKCNGKASCNRDVINQKPKHDQNSQDDLHAFFKKHVKPKKRHEIQNLSKVIDLLGGVSDCSCVIDVGSGLGHLSRILSFRYGLKVISVEAASSHAPKASKYDRDMEREVLKKKDKGEKSVMNYFQVESSSLPCHLTRLIHPNTSTEEFIDAIRQNQSSVNVCDSNGDAKNYRPAQSENSQQYCDQNSCKKMKIGDNSERDKACVKHRDSELMDCEGAKGDSGISSFDFREQTHGQQECSERLTTQTERKSSSNTFIENMQVSSERDDKIEKFILTGLHACGDLTATFLRFFVNCPEAKGLASVGCCYMKLTDESTLNETVGYPLSTCVQEIPNHQLSYAARELACHFADAYCQRLRDCPPHLRIHSYRAALEWIANQICPTFQRSAVQIPAKKTNNLDFEGYARLGLQKLGLAPEDMTDSLLSSGKQMTSQWKDVVSFYTVRLALAPVIETIILLDRMLFLYENGHDSAIVPIFDPSLSPRNFVLLAWKK